MGQHDDAANAALGAVVEVARQASADLMIVDLASGRMTPAKDRAAALRAASYGLPVGDVCASDPFARR